ncbi:MAG: transketolase C-terminal domain-containing protein, partial [Saprospiraceae bacterium]
ANKAADEMGVDMDIIDLRTLSPIDYDAIEASVKKTGKVIILHEDCLFGGLGGELSAYISEHLFEHLDGPVVRCGSLDTPVPFAPTLEKKFQPIDRFKAKVLELLAY